MPPMLEVAPISGADAAIGVQVKVPPGPGVVVKPVGQVACACAATGAAARMSADRPRRSEERMRSPNGVEWVA